MPTTLEHQLLQQTQHLSEDTIQQLIDYAQFLRQKQLADRDQVTAVLTSVSMNQTRHLDEEFKDYQHTFPRENE